MGRCLSRYGLSFYLMQGGELAWEGTDETFDPRNMVSGRAYNLVSDFVLPKELSPGTYDLRLALVDPTGTPTIRLAIEGDDGHLRYGIGRVEVVADAPEAVKLPEVRLEGNATKWAAAETLEANIDALVSFTYEVTGNPRHDLNNQDPDYCRFYALGSDHARVNEFRWFDRAGQPPAPLTVLVSTRDAGPYHLEWEAVGGGALKVSGVRIDRLRPGSVQRVSVADLDLADGAQVEQAVRVAFSRDRSQVQLPDDWLPYMHTDPARVPLRPDTSYSVWFDAVARPQLWQGDYHYMHVRAPGDTAPPEYPAFRWTHRHTDKPVIRTYTFRTGPEPGTVLEWGIKNGGAARISEVRIIEWGAP